MSHPWFRAWRTSTGVDGDDAPGFDALVRGRRVALVGPAATVLGTGAGAAIDACDVVVRLSETFEHLPFSRALTPDVGARCDVIYVNPVALHRRITDRDPVPVRQALDRSRACGLAYLVCANNGLEYRSDTRHAPSCPAPRRHLADDTAEVLRALAPSITFRMLFAASLDARLRLSGCYGRTGFIAVLDLLSRGAAELHLWGMTFYHGGGHLLDAGAPPLQPRANRDGTPSLDAEGRGHDSVRELRVIRELCRGPASRLRVDPALARVLDGAVG